MQGDSGEVPLPRIPDGISLIAFGDVHGCSDKLEALLERVAERVADFPERRHVLVSVGDLVDRGPDSARVVARLAGGIEGCELVVLAGNHEAMMLDFIRGGEAAESWLHNGGLSTMASYGVDLDQVLADGASLHSLRRALMEKLPPEHLGFLAGRPLTFVCGDYFFVHAGVRLPGLRRRFRQAHRARPHAGRSGDLQAQPHQPRHRCLLRRSAHRRADRGHGSDDLLILMAK